MLPFNNMSGDPEQEYFSDGITEDIITALSKHRWLAVIARNTSFGYKGQSVDIRRLADEKASEIPNCQYWTTAHKAVALAYLERQDEARRTVEKL